MKKVKKLLIGSLFLAVSIISCSEEVGILSPYNEQSTNANSGIYFSTTLYDSSNNFVGHCDPDLFNLTVLTSNGYLFDMTWDGLIMENTFVYSTESNLGGDLFIDHIYPLYGKSVFRVFSNYYTLKTLENGYSKKETNTISSLSVYSKGGSLQNRLEPKEHSFENKHLMRLKKINKREIGIPQNIILPFIVSNQ